MYYTRYVRRLVRTPPVQKPATSEHETGNCGTVVREHKGGMAKKLILDDADGGFWQRVSSHVGIRMPICKMLRRFDTSAPGTAALHAIHNTATCHAPRARPPGDNTNT